jgi:hypothetical protein
LLSTWLLTAYRANRPIRLGRPSGSAHEEEAVLVWRYARENEMRTIRTAADADAIRAEVEQFTDDGWDRDGTHFEWENWLDRLEGALDLDLGSDLDSEGIKRVQSIARKAAKDGLI